MASPMFSCFLLLGLFFVGTESIPLTFDLTFSTNATLVEVGHSFTATCKIGGNFSAPKEAYSIGFDNEGGQPMIAFEYPALNPKTPTNRQPKITVQPNPTHPYPNVAVHALNFNSTVFTILLTPSEVHNRPYSCAFRKIGGGGGYLNSARTSVSVINSPTVHFTSNVTQISLGTPFTTGCSISDFESKATSNYSVSFHSRTDGLLGSFIHQNGQILLSVQSHSSSILVHRGARTRFPHFELQITEKNGTNQELWCTLQVAQLQVKESNHWILPAVVRFTSSSPSNGSRSGICHLDDLLLDGDAYSVSFWTDLGPSGSNLLASYSVTPNEIVEFSAQTVAPWSEITFVGIASYPSFGILGRSTASFNGKKWWCTLELSGGTSSGKRVQYKSNEESLS